MRICSGKSKPSLDASNNILLASGSAPLVQDKNLGGSKSLTSNKRQLADCKKNSELNRHVKQKAYAGPLINCPDKAGGNLFRAQGTDGSGITSAKDVTSTRTPSAERLREPLPFRGRKELISLVQSSMQYANNSSIKGPSSQRKRVTAPSGKVDGKIVYLTPMPLHSSTVAAGLLRSKGVILISIFLRSDIATFCVLTALVFQGMENTKEKVHVLEPRDSVPQR